ncbi:GNAT family N-acetyltransferase [Catenulispora yoronensis]
MNPDGRPDAAEIGSTWLHPSAQRTGINTEAKLMMLTYAFEAWDVHRVSLKTDVRNTRSRAAISALGAQFEGIRRAHFPAADGACATARCSPSSGPSGRPPRRTWRRACSGTWTAPPWPPWSPAWSRCASTRTWCSPCTWSSRRWSRPPAPGDGSGSTSASHPGGLRPEDPGSPGEESAVSGLTGARTRPPTTHPARPPTPAPHAVR